MLSQALASLRGKSPDQIADIVRRRHIKGRAGTTYLCPMALLLKGEWTGSYVIGREYIMRRSGDKIEKGRTPKNVADFVRKFDIGGYPDLVLPPPRCLAQLGDKPKRPRGSGSHPPRRVRNKLAKAVKRFADTA